MESEIKVSTKYTLTLDDAEAKCIRNLLNNRDKRFETTVSFKICTAMWNALATTEEVL